MIIGIRKRQWLLILAAVASVLSINLIGMRIEVRYNEQVKARVLESVAESDLPPEIYAMLWGCQYPWLEIIAETAVVAASLAAFAWLVVFSSRWGFFQRLPLKIKYGGELLLAILTGVVFMVASMYFAYHWLEYFFCGLLLGLRQPTFVWAWSIQFVFPATSVLVFIALVISNRQITVAKVSGTAR